MQTDELIKRIEAALQATGKSARRASLDAELNADAVRNIRRGHAPDVPSLRKLERSLKVPENHFIDALDPAAPAAVLREDRITYPPGPESPPAEPSNVRPGPPVNLRGIAARDKDVPVRGTAIGGEQGDFSFNGEIVDMVRRPPGLANARDAFALYAHGDSMWPRFEPGDLLYVNPGRPPTPGCDVIVEMQPARGDTHGPCYVKRLVRRGADKVMLRQFNPGPGVKPEFSIPMKRIKGIWRVLTLAELLGV